MLPSAACPDICPSSRGHQADGIPISRTLLQGYIDIYLYSKEARSPRLSFLLDPSLASDSGRLEHGNASETNRKSCARTPPGPTLGSVIGQFNFRMTASLLGTIATAFCRDGQLERPGDVICAENQCCACTISLCKSFLHGLSVSHVKVCDVHHASLRCGQFCCKWRA